MITLDVTTDDKSGIAGMLSGLRDQLPYAYSLGLNNTAKAAQSAIRDTLPADFTLRRASFINQTVYIAPGDFAKKDRLSATVRINPARDFLAKFETDTTKSESTGRALAIPIPRQQTPALIIGSRSPLGVKTVMSLIQNQGGKHVGPFKRRGAARAQQQSFFLAKSKTGHTLVIQRTGPGSTRVLYEFVDQVSIEKHRLHFEETALRVALATWDENWTAALARAIETMR